MKVLISLLMLSGLAFLSGCSKGDDYEEELEKIRAQFAKEQAAIDAYLLDNDLEAEIDSASELRYIIHEQGTGSFPLITDTVHVIYTGFILEDNGMLTEFEADTSIFFLGVVIPGWQELLPNLREGGKMTMFIPSVYGFHDQDLGEIPPYSTLVFDVELQKIEVELSEEAQFQLEQAAINSYIQENNLVADADTIAGLKYVILVPGEGEYPAAADSVVVSYTGTFLESGNTFDSGTNVKLKLGQTIQGWRILLPYINEGGRIRMFIPSKYGYGKGGKGSIPGNSTLIFDVDLVEVRKQ